MGMLDHSVCKRKDNQEKAESGLQNKKNNEVFTRSEAWGLQKNEEREDNVLPFGFGEGARERAESRRTLLVPP